MLWLLLLFVIPAQAQTVCQPQVNARGRALPSSSDGEVPVNTWIWYRLERSDGTDTAGEPDVELTDLEAGEPVALEFLGRADGPEQVVWAFRPTVELAANRDFELQFEVEPATELLPGRNSFRTGDFRDTEAPAAPTETSRLLQSDEAWVVWPGDCPEDVYQDYAELRFDADGPLLLAATPGQARRLGDDLFGEVRAVGEDGRVYLQDSVRPGGVLDLEVRAVDLAGNGSPWADLPVDSMPAAGCTTSSASAAWLLLLLPLVPRRASPALLALLLLPALLAPSVAEARGWNEWPSGWRAELHDQATEDALILGTSALAGVAVQSTIRFTLAGRPHGGLELLGASHAYTVPMLFTWLTTGLMREAIHRTPRPWQLEWGYRGRAFATGTAAALMWAAAVPLGFLLVSQHPAWAGLAAAPALSLTAMTVALGVGAERVARLQRGGRARVSVHAGPGSVVVLF